jgi:dienelactone hydrolase
MWALVVLAAAQVAAPSPWIAAEARITSGGRSGRDLVRTDPAEKSYVLSGRWDTASWRELKADGEGWLRGSGYVAVDVPSDSDRIALLEATGPSLVYTGDGLRPGDVYGYGNLALPVKLRKGSNPMIFRVDRGRLRVAVSTPEKPVSWDPRDITLPDRRPGLGGTLWAGIIARNATESTLSGYEIETVSEGGGRRRAAGSAILPLSLRKLAVPIDAKGTGKVRVILRKGGQVLDESTVELRNRKAGETYKVTFRSEIDGSIQYYGVNPSSKPGAGQALVLSLHGASVEAIGQADAYGPRDWGTVVAATNRRPYGFDWEEVGRRDALEVLDHARRTLKPDPAQTYLTGHSMGGHGTWQVGVLYPYTFAAIGPSAGWISFASYAGGVSGEGADPVRKILYQASSSSDTLALSRNYGSLGIFAWHGIDDDNVPISEMRKMRESLAPWHPALATHEQPGAGHWWDVNPAPGADAVDFAPAWEFMRKFRRGENDRISLRCPNPSINGKADWLTIEQLASNAPFGTVDAKRIGRDRFEVTTADVRALTLNPEGSQPVEIAIDGERLTVSNLTLSSAYFDPFDTSSRYGLPDTTSAVRAGLAKRTRRIHLVRDGKWRVVPSLPAEAKSAGRYGPIKEILNRRVVFVYGTGDDGWAMRKARFDAETFLYRGNAAVDVVSDREFDPRKFRDRNVVLYGDASSNRAIGKLIDGEVEVVQGRVRVGDRTLVGDHALAFVRPRRDSRFAMVAVIGATGPEGYRLIDRLPLFGSGVGIPDFVAFGPSLLEGEIEGIRAAGIFGHDWSARSGNFAWR